MTKNNKNNLKAEYIKELLGGINWSDFVYNVNDINITRRN